MKYIKSSSVLLIIPAFNEEGNIARTMEELSCHFSDYDYLIINDGSSDTTEEICRKAGYRYISMPINVGLAGAFRTGMKYADKYGYDYALQYDGDGQHDPQYIGLMREKMNCDDADIVIGSRFMKKGTPVSMRSAGSRLIRILIKLTTGMTITDPTSGMRLYNRKMIHLFANDINLPPEPDTMAYLIREGYRISEVPVEMRQREMGSSYLNFGNAVRYMINICISIIFIQWFRKDKRR